MEFLGANSLIIQLGNGRLSSRDKHVSAPAFVKACQRDDQEIVYRVSLAKKDCAERQINFPGVVKPNLNLALRRSVVQPESNRVVVRVVNTSPTPITL